jgi:hypothetical protein
MPKTNTAAAAEFRAKQQAVRRADGLIDLGKPASELLSACLETDLPDRIDRLVSEVAAKDATLAQAQRLLMLTEFSEPADVADWQEVMGMESQSLLEAKLNNERLRSDLAHCRENAGDESCAGYALENQRLRMEVAEMKSQLAMTETQRDLARSLLARVAKVCKPEAMEGG